MSLAVLAFCLAGGWQQAFPAEGRLTHAQVREIVHRLPSMVECERWVAFGKGHERWVRHRIACGLCDHEREKWLRYHADVIRWTALWEDAVYVRRWVSFDDVWLRLHLANLRAGLGDAFFTGEVPPPYAPHWFPDLELSELVLPEPPPPRWGKLFS